MTTLREIFRDDIEFEDLPDGALFEHDGKRYRKSRDVGLGLDGGGNAFPDPHEIVEWVRVGTVDDLPGPAYVGLRRGDGADLKARNVKPQMWLGPSPSAWAAYAGADEANRNLASAIERYMSDPCTGTAHGILWASMLLLTPRDEYPFDTALRVFEYGASKYSPGNFRRAFDDPRSMRREYVSGMLRHLRRLWLLSEYIDTDTPDGAPGSGLPHIAHVQCGAWMLYEMELGGDGLWLDVESFVAETEGDK